MTVPRLTNSELREELERLGLTAEMRRSGTHRTVEIFAPSGKQWSGAHSLVVYWRVRYSVSDSHEQNAIAFERAMEAGQPQDCPSDCECREVPNGR